MDRDFETVFPSGKPTFTRFSALLTTAARLDYARTLEECWDFNREVSLHLEEFDREGRRDYWLYAVPHVDQVLGCLVGEQRFGLWDGHDRNLMMWVCLLHDIQKRIDSTGFRDPFHPFRSAATIIRYMSRWNWLSHPNSAEQLAQKIENATELSYGCEIHDNKQLPEIITGILRLSGVEMSDLGYAESVKLLEIHAKQRLFEVEIILLTLLHQSLTLVRRYPSVAPLSDREIYRYFSKRLIQLLTTLALCDSASYTIVNEPELTRSNRAEIERVMARYESLLPS